MSEPIHPLRWAALAVWIVLFTASTAVGFRIVLNVVHDNAKARDALCVRRNALRGEIDRTVKYLQDVHTGKRQAIAGITEAEILQSLQDDRAEVISLNPLDCPSPPARPK